MKQTARNKAKKFIYQPQGELTIYTAAQTKAGLFDALAGREAVELDLSQVSDMDSAGLQLLILARQEAHRRNVQLNMTGHSAAVLDVIELCNLSGLFSIPQVIHSAKPARSKPV